MDNGVRLYQSRNYGAALAEFAAAYAARPGPSPLIDEALCHREQFDYPRALAALERALASHASAMSPEDRRAVEASMRELRGLLAYVQVQLDPADAVLSVDGRDVALPPGGRLPLSPGPHRLGARANGRVPQEERIVIASGEERALSIVLPAATGTVRVTARAPTTPIEIDGEVVGRGDWMGSLRAGRHEVRLVGEGTSLSIDVAPGEALDVRGDRAAADGGLRPLPAPPPPPPPPARRPEPEPRGPYALAAGSVLFPALPPDTGAGSGLGAAATLRGGWRANALAGFELLLGGATASGSGVAEGESWTRGTVRGGAGVRVSTPGRTLRLVGAVDGGVAWNNLAWEGRPGAAATADGIDPFGVAELGLEVEMTGGILLGVAIEAWFDGIAAARTDDGDRPFDGGVVPSVGPSIRAGLALW
jgi:hypothetical protein